MGLLVGLAPAAALAAPGELDQGYATGGVFTAAFQSPQSPGQLAFAAVDSQRRTVIAATHVDAQGQSHLDVLRLTPQGTVDTSFGSGGVVEVDFSASLNGLNLDVVARGVAIAGGDKVVALGWVNDPVHTIEYTALVRLGSDGSYDPTFGQNGRVVDDLRSQNYTGFPDSLAVDQFDRVLVGGSCGNGCHGFVARYTATGAPDTPGFNATDAVHPGVQVIGQASDVSSLATLADGSVLVAGGTSPTDDAVIARIRPDGLLDASFNAGGPTPGVVTSGMGRANPQTSVAVAYGVAPGPGGSVYATGEVADNGISARLLRLTQAGSPDPAFGNGTPATGVVSIPGTNAHGVAVTVDSSSCPVVAGDGTAPNSTSSQIFAARLTPNGQLDRAFNPAGATPGTALFAVGDSAFGQTVALQNDGDIVIGGNLQQGTNPVSRKAVALRLQGGGCGTVPAPTAVTGQATNISTDGATLNGTVNPNGSQVTDCHFDYGTTPQYGSRASCSPSSGAGTAPVAVSATLSGLGSGKTWDYRVVATGPGGTSTGGNQTVTTLPAPTSTTLTTRQTWQATQGSSITVPFDATGERDEATITGDNTFMAGGTVTFALYSDPQCTQASQVFTSTNRTAGNPQPFSLADSDPVSTQLAPGAYYWTAAYSGDSRNQGSASACGSEVLTVQPPPSTTTLSTTQVWGNSTRGASITVPGSATGEHDEAQLSGANAASSSGRFTFSLYRQAAEGPQCTGAPVFTSTVSFAPDQQGGASSQPVPTQLAPGTYYWTVSYSGDGANQPSSSLCGAEILTVQPPQPTTLSTTQVWGNSTRGASITVPGSASGEHDEAQLSGANAALSSGAFTFSLYRQAPTLLQCRGTPVFTSTVSFAPDQQGGASSQPVPTQLAPGTYFWTVTYSGDGANQPSNSPCGAETLTIVPLRFSPYGTVISAQTLALTMSCTAPPCTIKITISLVAPLRASDARLNTKRNPSVITLARGKLTIRKHGPHRVLLHLTPAGRRFASSHHGRVNVNAVLAVTVDGHTRVIRQRLTMKITKPGKRQPG